MTKSKQYEHTARFVAPLPEPRSRVEIVEVQRELPAPPQTVLLPHAGYEDRARGFSLATAPLACVAGLVAALVGIIGWQVPFASLVTLLLALGGFALVWLLAFVAHMIISPDGAMFFHTILAWAYLRDEAKERHRRYREARRD